MKQHLKQLIEDYLLSDGVLEFSYPPHEVKFDNKHIEMIVDDLYKIIKQNEQISFYLKYFRDNCWTFEAWSEHSSGEVYYFVKLTCGVQSRSRYTVNAPSLKEACEKAHKLVHITWGELGGRK